MSWKGSNIETKEKEMGKICQKSKENTKTILNIVPYKYVYSSARTMCQMLGGTMPLPIDDNNFNETIGQYLTPNIIESCNEIWLPIIQVNNYVRLWVSPYKFYLYF